MMNPKRIEAALSGDGDLCVECNERTKIVWACPECWRHAQQGDYTKSLVGVADRRWGLKGKGPFDASIFPK